MNKYNQLTVLEEVKHSNRLMYSVQCWSKLLLAYHGNPDPSVLNTLEVGMKEQRLGGEDVTNNPSTSAQQPTNLVDDIV